MENLMDLNQFLKEKGISQKELEKLLEPTIKTPKVLKPRVTKQYRFGVIGDTHLCDKSQALDELHDFYKRCESGGVTEVVHAGDLVTGSGVYRTQITDLLCYSFDDQLEYARKYYPKLKNGETYFITGNHENAGWKETGVAFGPKLASLRPDLVFVGDYDAHIVLNGVRVGLHHGAKGVPYSISYHLQKYIEKIGAGQKPQIYVLGHYHATLQLFYRNIHAFLPGCFQKPNDLSVRLGLPNTVGGWILDLEVGADRKHSIESIKSEYISYY